MADNKAGDLIKVGITAGAIGAAAGVVGTLMSDKKNRKKVGQKVDDVKKWSDQKVNEWKKKVDDVQDDMQTTVKKAEDQAQEMKEKGEEGGEKITQKIQTAR